MSKNIKLKNYFQSPEFTQFLDALKEKYINYGSCIGTINITPKTIDEAHKLSGFLSKNIKLNIKTNIKITDIQKSLDDSVFEGTNVDDLVFLFFPNIKSKKEEKIELNNYIKTKLEEYKLKYYNTCLMNLFEQKESLKKIKYLIVHDLKLLDNIFKSLINLPMYNNDINYLAIFSSKITGDPHYYDLDSANCNNLIQFICFLQNYNYENRRIIKKDILEKVGILIDEVSNIVITYNLYGNPLLDNFQKYKTPLTINLDNLRKMNNINCQNNNLLIVENPSFISLVIDKEINYSVIITSGNSNYIVYKLLEKLGDVNIFFNGDFDPEGLLIAQSFKDRYPSLKFIGYNQLYFNNGISRNEISLQRLKKLDNINDVNLNIIKELLIINKVSSYQESNYNMLIKDINNYIK